MGAMRLAGPAGRLERLALEGDLSEANDLLGQIRTEFEKLEAFVANPNRIEEAVRISGDQVAVIRETGYQDRKHLIF